MICKALALPNRTSDRLDCISVNVRVFLRGQRLTGVFDSDRISSHQWETENKVPRLALCSQAGGYVRYQ